MPSGCRGACQRGISGPSVSTHTTALQRNEGVGPPGSCSLAFLVGMDTRRCEMLPHFVLEIDPLISINLRIISIKKKSSGSVGDGAYLGMRDAVPTAEGGGNEP